eukprot:11880078-Karenia_brevis.AAC.1
MEASIAENTCLLIGKVEALPSASRLLSSVASGRAFCGLPGSCGAEVDNVRSGGKDLAGDPSGEDEAEYVVPGSGGAEGDNIGAARAETGDSQRWCSAREGRPKQPLPSGK